MRLVERRSRRRKFVRQDCVEALRDVGVRLEMLVRRYEALVNDVGATPGAAPDFTGRLDLVNGQLAYVTRRLQELFIHEHDAKLAALSLEIDEATERVFPRGVTPISA